MLFPNIAEIIGQAWKSFGLLHKNISVPSYFQILCLWGNYLSVYQSLYYEEIINSLIMCFPGWHSIYLLLSSLYGAVF